MKDEEVLHRLYKWLEQRTSTQTTSREKEIAILAYKLGKGILTIEKLES